MVLPATATMTFAGTAGHVLTAAFGRVNGEAVEVFTLTNAAGIELRVMTYGAAIVSLKTPDRSGRLANIVLGFDDLDPYVAGTRHFGATVGRYANRIANGRFSLDGNAYSLSQNDGHNSLHGGLRGFDKRIWKAVPLTPPQAATLRLTYSSAAGEEGFPGELTSTVTYQLRDDNTLSIEFQAHTTTATVVNLANHAYFNLSGNPATPVLDHLLTLNAEEFTPVDASLIPTGELRSVAGTPFDFRTPARIGSRIGTDDEQLRLGHGYDHNWVLNKSQPGGLSLAATLTDPATGRTLEVRTTQPGIQFYSGNFLNGSSAGNGGVFQYRTGLCLETQHFPDSPNHSAFPSTTLHSGETYKETTVLAFRTTR